MVDERGRAEPQLCAVLAGGIHDAEIVLAVAQQHVLLALRELGDASHQILDLVVSFPATQIPSAPKAEEAGNTERSERLRRLTMLSSPRF